MLTFNEVLCNNCSGRDTAETGRVLHRPAHQQTLNIKTYSSVHFDDKLDISTLFCFCFQLLNSIQHILVLKFLLQGNKNTTFQLLPSLSVLPPCLLNRAFLNGWVVVISNFPHSPCPSLFFLSFTSRVASASSGESSVSWRCLLKYCGRQTKGKNINNIMRQLSLTVSAVT